MAVVEAEERRESLVFYSAHKSPDQGERLSVGLTGPGRKSEVVRQRSQRMFMLSSAKWNGEAKRGGMAHAGEAQQLVDELR
jgi:hypothetical protein